MSESTNSWVQEMAHLLIVFNINLNETVGLSSGFTDYLIIDMCPLLPPTLNHTEAPVRF